MSKYNFFRTKTKNSTECSLNHEFNSMLNGSMGTEIYSFRLQKTIKAALNISETEGPDKTIVFTQKTKNCGCGELLKGDYFCWKNKIYFVYEDIALVRETNYIKQLAYECNVEFSISENEVSWGYFVSSLTKYVSDSGQKDIVIISGEKPILVLPYKPWAVVGLKIFFGGKFWRVVDTDLITNKGIAYLSLERDFDEIKSAPEEQPNEDMELNIGEIPVNTEIEVSTNNAYFESTPNVQIISRQVDKVKFIVPFGVDILTIKTKNENNEVCEKTYKVVMI